MGMKQRKELWRLGVAPGVTLSVDVLGDDGFEVEIDPGVAGAVTVRLTDDEARAMAEAILAVPVLEFELVPPTIRRFSVAPDGDS